MHDDGRVRAEFFRALIDLLPTPEAEGPAVLVGVDGVDGAGKTVLADDLAARLRPRVPVVRVSIDDFHQVRAIRHRRGRRSPEGFWLDSYDYGAFLRGVVEPFRSGTGSYLPAGHDLDSDAVLTGPRLPVVPGSLVVIDGIFLHRPELCGVWDFSVFLDVPFAESVARMSRRDGSSPEPDAAENARYVGGQRLYLAASAPARRATVHVDYADVARPRILRPAL